MKACFHSAQARKRQNLFKQILVSLQEHIVHTRTTSHSFLEAFSPNTLPIIMKKIVPLYILFALLLAAACHQNDDLKGKTPEEKLAILDKKIRQKQKDADLYAQRASVFIELGRYSEALNDLGHATTLNENNADYYLQMADAYIKMGNIDRCYEVLQKANDLKPNNTNILLKLGEAAYYHNDFERALVHLTAVTEKEPNNRTALFMKSFIYLEQKDTASAVVLLDKICGLYPDFMPAFEHLGSIYASRRSPLALEYYNTALRIEPKNCNVRYGIAKYYQSIGDYEQAEHYYKEMLDIDENLPDAWHNRGYIQLFYYSDYELAVEYFSQALTCDSTHVASLVNRGIAYELLNNKQKARDDYNHALRLQPDFQPAIDGVKRLP